MKTRRCGLAVFFAVLVGAIPVVAQDGVDIQGVTYSTNALESAYGQAKREFFVFRGKVISVDRDKAEYISGSVLQIIDDNTVRIEHRNSDIVLLNFPTQNLAEDTRIECIGRREGVYRYVTVMGSMRQIASYRWTPVMTRSQFLAAARNGAFAEILNKFVPQETAYRVPVRYKPLSQQLRRPGDF